MKKISVVGAESTGKTTLAEALGNHYRTVVVAEQARVHLQRTGGLRRFEDMAAIATAQIESENALISKARRLMICDGGPLSVAIWSGHYFGRCDQVVNTLVDTHLYDLYLLLNIDCAWVPNGLRTAETSRQELHHRFVAELSSRELPFVLISGSSEERLSQAVQFIDSLLGIDHSPPSGCDTSKASTDT